MRDCYIYLLNVEELDLLLVLLPVLFQSLRPQVDLLQQFNFNLVAHQQYQFMSEEYPQNPYPTFDNQTPNIEEAVAAQAALVTDPTLSDGSEEQKKYVFLTICTSQVIQTIYTLILTLIFCQFNSFGLVVNFFYFLSFILSVHLMMFSHKTRGVLKEASVNKLNFVLFVNFFSLFVGILSARMTTLLGMLYVNPYLSFMITNFFLLIVSIIRKDRPSNSKSFTQRFIIFCFFMDLIMSLFNSGKIHFGCIIGQVLSYFYGQYILHLKTQILYPITSIVVEEQNQQEQPNRFVQLVQVFVAFFEIGNIPQSAPIDMQSYLRGFKDFKAILKFICLLILIGTLFYIFPFLYIGLYVLAMYFIHKADTKLIQIGKKEEIKIHETTITPILASLDLLGVYKYQLE